MGVVWINPKSTFQSRTITADSENQTSENKPIRDQTPGPNQNTKKCEHCSGARFPQLRVAGRARAYLTVGCESAQSRSESMCCCWLYPGWFIWIVKGIVDVVWWLWESWVHTTHTAHAHMIGTHTRRRTRSVFRPRFDSDLCVMGRNETLGVFDALRRKEKHIFSNQNNNARWRIVGWRDGIMLELHSNVCVCCLKNKSIIPSPIFVANYLANRDNK